MLKNNFKFAFTLAEVLITLGVIGVVAAMTIPVLVQNYQRHEYVTRLKKAYTTLNTGFQQIIINAGCEGEKDALECTGLFGSENSDYTLENQTYRKNLANAIERTFKLTETKFCSEDDVSFDCTRTWKYLKGSLSTSSTWLKNKLIFKTADGYMFTINTKLKCTSNPYNISPKYTKDCAAIIVDTNGSRKPNQLGRDTFEIALSQSGYLIPIVGTDYAYAKDGNLEQGLYWQNTPAQCGDKDKSLSQITANVVSGANCLARIMENGWIMDY